MGAAVRAQRFGRAAGCAAAAAELGDSIVGRRGECGATLSTADYKAEGWYPATLPSTVLSALAEECVSRPLFRHEPAPDFGNVLSDLVNFSNSRCRRIVRSGARGGTGARLPFRPTTREDGLAGVRRHQLPRQRVDEREADCVAAHRGSMAPFRIRRQRGGETRRGECAGHRSISAAAA